MIVPAIIAIRGTAKSDAKKVSMYYYGKVTQDLLLSIIGLLEYNDYCQIAFCDGQSLLEVVLGIGLINLLYLYQAHVMFSYVNHVARGNVILANNGQELTENMDRIQQNAAALELEQVPAVVIGTPVTPSPDGVGQIVHVESNPVSGQIGRAHV